MTGSTPPRFGSSRTARRGHQADPHGMATTSVSSVPLSRTMNRRGGKGPAGDHCLRPRQRRLVWSRPGRAGMQRLQQPRQPRQLVHERRGQCRIRRASARNLAPDHAGAISPRPLFHVVLGPRRLYRLPLHIGRVVAPAVLKRLDMIDHIAWASSAGTASDRTGRGGLERIPRRAVALRPPPGTPFTERSEAPASDRASRGPMRREARVVSVTMVRPGARARGRNGDQDDTEQADEACPRDHSRALPVKTSRWSAAVKGE